MRVGEAAVSHAIGEATHRSEDWAGLCKKFVRLCFDVPSTSSSAATCWTQAQHKHPWTVTPPAGVAVFWGGGSRGFGHVALSAGRGLCYSTDYKRTGYVDLVNVAAIGPGWGLRPLGWTEDFDGAQVFNPPRIASPHILHLQHLAHIGAPLTAHELHELHLWNQGLT